MSAESWHAAILSGNLDEVKAFRVRYPHTANECTCPCAAGKGHLHILKWMREQNIYFSWKECLCENAAANGHLQVLQWLRAQDPPCPWSVDTCIYAAQYGHLHILEWLRAQSPPCPWDAWTCDWFISANKRYTVFQRLQKHECVALPHNVLQWMAEVDLAVKQVSTSSDIQSLVKQFVEL